MLRTGEIFFRSRKNRTGEYERRNSELDDSRNFSRADTVREGRERCPYRRKFPPNATVAVRCACHDDKRGKNHVPPNRRVRKPRQSATLISSKNRVQTRGRHYKRKIEHGTYAKVAGPYLPDQPAAFAHIFNHTHTYTPYVRVHKREIKLRTAHARGKNPRKPAKKYNCFSFRGPHCSFARKPDGRSEQDRETKQ